MTKEKLDELIADLGYASMYLKQARAEAKGGDFQINRTRELLGKVADALIAERGTPTDHRSPRRPPSRGSNDPDYVPPSRRPMNGRTWTDTRRAAVLAGADKVVEFERLTNAQVSKLYDIVVDENENWDGEEVSVESILTIMVARYNAHGLSPSRN